MKKPETMNQKVIFFAIGTSFKKLNFRTQSHNPVMFVTFIGAMVVSCIFVKSLWHSQPAFFEFQISLWLWATVLFANFAESLAEGQGKAQADSLRKSRVEMTVKKMVKGKIELIPSNQIQKDDVLVCEAGDTIPIDGEVIEGIASVDESAITGESAPVVRESGGDRSAVTGGTRVISDRIVMRVTAEPGKSFIDRMISLIEGAVRQKTPNEIALSIVLSGLTLVFLLTVTSLKFFADYAQNSVSVSILIALLVCLIPTTIGGLLSAIGIAGIDKLIQKNVIAKSGRAIEAAGDVDVILLDKTGTITLGNRMATEFIPAPGISEKILAETAQLASFSDETPEGRSIVVLAKNKFNLRCLPDQAGKPVFVHFMAQTQMSGVDFIGDDDKISASIRKGSVEAITRYVVPFKEKFPSELESFSSAIANSGGTPLAVAKDGKVIGLIHLKDMVKGGIKERFAQMRQMGIRTVMITGDNPLTAAAIAAEAGVDDFIAQAGKQMLMTRGSLTTFSIANDIAKYFAIIPALFPAVGALNIMHLASPRSAILSAVIFNALIIIFLVPLALKGVRYRAQSAVALVRRNLLIYGFGGVIAPFVGIKIIDLILMALGWV